MASLEPTILDGQESIDGLSRSKEEVCTSNPYHYVDGVRLLRHVNWRYEQRGVRSPGERRRRIPPKRDVRDGSDVNLNIPSYILDLGIHSERKGFLNGSCQLTIRQR